MLYLKEDPALPLESGKTVHYQSSMNKWYVMSANTEWGPELTSLIQ